MAVTQSGRTRISAERKAALCADMRRLNGLGCTQSQVAAELGLSATTVRR